MYLIPSLFLLAILFGAAIAYPVFLWGGRLEERLLLRVEKISLFALFLPLMLGLLGYLVYLYSFYRMIYLLFFCCLFVYLMNLTNRKFTRTNAIPHRVALAALLSIWVVGSFVGRRFEEGGIQDFNPWVSGRHIYADIRDSLREAKDQKARIFLIDQIGSLGDRRAVPYLKEALKDGDPEVRLAAAHALRQIGDPDALAALTAADPHRKKPVKGCAFCDAIEAISQGKRRGVTIQRDAPDRSGASQ
jgi:hypothetical protein